jgi:hypothetical protein
MESTWNLSFHMESTWNPHGNRMEFMWNIPYGFLVEIPCGMVESTWNPHGIHMEFIFPHGIHMESTWK